MLYLAILMERTHKIRLSQARKQAKRLAKS